ncbi:ESX secretion-associated protein EspG [Amycolatopsis tucumanensis]|uniref:ESX secretion-associated protein EspG n=1 Tax=Amycolatopsis tucumanensis TaxID=401106 RepID=A0ABP7JCY5_9PSEU|nr:ESX secretion-associated protein EspG [Amycolatopsis tucumanensis]MCF6423835.1 ESX secretion-associated protein EspG [Amycolatopsis tucumanensis]
MTPRRPDFVLSAPEFDLLWGDLELPPAPYPLRVPSNGRTFAVRARLTDEVYRSCAERGLASGRRLDARLEALLALLAGPEVSVDAVGHIGYPVRALAAAAGRTGVLAVLAGGEIWLTEIPPTALVPEIVAVFPPGTPGAPVDQFTVDALAGSRSSGGQIGAHAGTRSSTVVTWFDSSRGRYLVSRDGDGITVTPTDDARLTDRVTALLTSTAEIHTVGM